MLILRTSDQSMIDIFYLIKFINQQILNISMSAGNINMIALAKVSSDGYIDLQDEALKILQKFIQGQITFITLQGFVSKRYKIGQTFASAKLRSQANSNMIWMRPEPIYDNKTQKYFFFLEADIVDESARDSIHTFCCLISYVVIVALNQQDDLKFLAAIKRKVTDDASSVKYLDSKDKYKMAYLLGLIPSQKQTASIPYFEDVTDKMLSKLAEQGIQNEVLSSYPQAKCLACPQQHLQYSSNELERNLLAQVQEICDRKRSNTQLMYGPIMTDFMDILAQKLNTKGKVNLQQAQNEIQIQQAYEAFMVATKRYHQSSIKCLEDAQRPDDTDITYSLEWARKDAISQYFKHGGSSNMQYQRRLQNYIDSKEAQIKRIYTNEQRKNNLQILQNQSKVVLDRLKNEKGEKDPKKVKQHLQAFKRNYQHQARGPEKYQLYNEYMKIFTPIAYGDPEAEKQLDRNRRTNKKLLQQLQKRKKKSGGCCSGDRCEIF